MSAPRLPSFSGSSRDFSPRKSRSKTYTRGMLEYPHILNEVLPMIWIRDVDLVTPDLVELLEMAYRKYRTLCIPQEMLNEEKRRARTRAGRKKLEAEYKLLDEETRNAKEFALAMVTSQHDPFCIRGEDGTLDYHTDSAPPKPKKEIEDEEDDTELSKWSTAKRKLKGLMPFK